MHGKSVQQRQYIITRRLHPDSEYMVLYDNMYEYVRVYTSMYEHVRVYTSKYQYNQGLQTTWSAHNYFSLLAPKYDVQSLTDVSVHL